MAKEKPFYGWKLLAILFLIYFSASVTAVGGNIINTIMVKETGMSRSIFGIGFALAYLLIGLASPLAASLSKKIGERATIVSGMAAITLSAVLMALMGENKIIYIAAYGVLNGTGAALATILPIQTLITRWFSRKRAMATGIFLSAGGFAGILSSIFINRIMGSLGNIPGNWKPIWIYIAILNGLTALIAAMGVKNSPEEMGQSPDGISYDQNNIDNRDSTTGKIRRKLFQSSINWKLKDASKTSSFWLLLLAAITQFMGFYLCLNQGMIHLMDQGISMEIATLSTGLLMAASISGKLSAGVFGDRFEPRFVIMAGLMLSVVGYLVLMKTSSVVLIYVYAILLGHGFGFVYVCLFTMLANYYGPGSIRSFLGLMLPIVTVFGAAGPALGGMLKDHTGSYSAPLLSAVALAIIGFVALIFATPPIEKNSTDSM